MSVRTSAADLGVGSASVSTAAATRADNLA